MDAVLEDKDHPRQGIWVDQLCIDQASGADKQRAVAAMDVIYESCTRLLVLLEDVFLDAREVALMEKYDPSKRNFKRLWRPEGDGEKEAFVGLYAKVNAARWWERAWCSHEFSMSEPWNDKRMYDVHDAGFVINAPGGGTVKMKWLTLNLLMGSALNFLEEKAGNVWSGFKGWAVFSGFRSGEDRENGWRSSLMARHNGVAMKGCTQMEDRLSIMINLCGLGLAYVGGPLESKEEVLYISVLLALAAGEVYPLTMFDKKCLTLDDGPTWLARSIVARDTTIPNFRQRALKTIHTISPCEIDLDVLFVSVPWQWVPGGLLTPTYSIFPDLIPTTQPVPHFRSPHLDTINSSHSDLTLDIRRRAFLAACLLNGHTFTARLWAQLYRDVVVSYYNTSFFKNFAPNTSLLPAARMLLAILLPVTSLLALPYPPSFGLEDALLFLTWLTDLRSLYYLRLAIGVGGEALITEVSGNKWFGEGPEREMRLGVPVELVGTSCIFKRAWILRPRGGGGWRIVGKG